ncbi:MAG: NAD(P)H-hydrate dehydratase [Nanoarchaeota archaeon]
MKLVEHYSASFGVTTSELMESAGRAAADYIAKVAKKTDSILVTCYHGNNGGDGFCCARHLAKNGYSVNVHFTGDAAKMKQEAARQWRLLPKRLLVQQPDYHAYDLVIDAILGTGRKLPLKEPIASAVLQMRKARRVIALDVPTSDDLPVEATVCFHVAKPEARGKVVVVSIGVPQQLTYLNLPVPTVALRSQVEQQRKLEQDRFVRKGDHGRILVVGGSSLYVGAPYLAGMAALAVSDLVVVAAPKKVAWAINVMSPDLITVKLKGDDITKEHLSAIQAVRHDAMLLGNGMGRSDAIPLLLRFPGKKVIDADAFHCADLRKLRNAILTPHRGEFERLMRNSGIRSALLTQVMEFERKLFRKIECRKEFTAMEKGISKLQPKLGSNVILLKGPVDLIISGQDWKFNVTGVPRMAVGGTGDVLAGLCAGFAATMPLFDAACKAAFLCGRAGEITAEKNPRFLASDLIASIEAAGKETGSVAGRSR